MTWRRCVALSTWGRESHQHSRSRLFVVSCVFYGVDSGIFKRSFHWGAFGSEWVGAWETAHGSDDAQVATAIWEPISEQSSSSGVRWLPGQPVDADEWRALRSTVFILDVMSPRYLLNRVRIGQRSWFGRDCVLNRRNIISSYFEIYCMPTNWNCSVTTVAGVIFLHTAQFICSLNFFNNRVLPNSKYNPFTDKVKRSH